jgi:hypothetical protein
MALTMIVSFESDAVPYDEGPSGARSMTTTDTAIVDATVQQFLIKDVCRGLYAINEREPLFLDSAVFVFTLESTPLRHAYIKAELLRHKINATICVMNPASDLVFSNYVTAGGQLSKSDLGTSAAHAWILNYASKFKKVIILEDDLIMPLKMSKVKLDKSPSLLCAKDENISRSKSPTYEADLKSGQVLGRSAYFVNGSDALMLSKNLRNLSKPCDEMLQCLWPNLTVFWPPLFLSSASAVDAVDAVDVTKYDEKVDFSNVHSCFRSWPKICDSCQERNDLIKFSNKFSFNVAKNFWLSLEKPVIAKDDTCIGIAYFNFSKNERSIQNLYKALQCFSGLPVWVMEIYENEPMVTETFGATVISRKTSSYLFSKENCWNILAKEMPQKYTKFIFLDADIVAEDPKLWYDKCSNELDVAHVIQPMSNILYEEFDSKGIMSLLRKSSAMSVVRQKLYDPTMIFPRCGYGLGIRRDYFDKIGGFVDMALCGGGYLMNVLTLMTSDALEKQHAYMHSPFAHLDVKRLKAAVAKHKPILSFIQYDLKHLYHGSRSDRQYQTRHAAMSKLTPADFVKDNGLIQFKNPDCKANIEMKKYFLLRNEDA